MKPRIGSVIVCAIVVIATACAPTKHTAITQDELVRNTQELNDAITAGDQAPWNKYLADDAMYMDEKGRGMDKPAMVKTIEPLPNGYSGNIKVVNPKSHIEGDTAILSYDLDETETIFGQNMTARYHGTDTWMYRNGKWQIAAGQMLRYYEDPAPGKIDSKEYAAYVGTYELAPGVTQTVTAEGNDLFARRTGHDKVQLIPEAYGVFFRKGVEGRFLFERDDHGKVNTLIDRRNNEDVAWKRVR